MIAVFIYKLGSTLGGILPSRVSDAVAWIIGQASCLLRWRTRKVVEDNLRIVHGDTLTKKELRKKSRRVIMNFAYCIRIFLEITAFDWEELRALCDFSEFDKAVEEIGKDKAFIITTAHLGPWELGGLCLSRMGYRVHTVALDHPSKRVTRFYDERRRQVGVMAYPVTDSFAILKEALDSGGVVALLTERSYGRARKKQKFFGIERDLPVGYLVLALRCSVPVITGAILLDGNRRFRYVHGGVYYPCEGVDESVQIDELQKKCLGDFEKIIKENSDQWFHFRPLRSE